jgi:hypothetical protein
VVAVMQEVRRNRQLSNEHLINHRKRALCYIVSEAEERIEHGEYNAKVTTRWQHSDRQD